MPSAAIIELRCGACRSGRNTSRSSATPASGDRHHRDGHRRPVVQPGARHQRVGEVRAEHEQLAVREVRHLHGAVDQGQPERDEAVDAAGDQTVEDLLREEFHRLTR